MAIRETDEGRSAPPFWEKAREIGLRKEKLAAETDLLWACRR